MSSFSFCSAHFFPPWCLYLWLLLIICGTIACFFSHNGFYDPMPKSLLWTVSIRCHLEIIRSIAHELGRCCFFILTPLSYSWKISISLTLLVAKMAHSTTITRKNNGTIMAFGKCFAHWNIRLDIITYFQLSNVDVIVNCSIYYCIMWHRVAGTKQPK